MSDLPDASMIQQLRDIYAKHIDEAKAKFAQGGTVDAGVYTPDVDYGYDMPNGYSFNTPPSHAASSGRPAQVYAEGGDVDDYGSGRFTRTPAERRVVRERSSAMHVPERSAEWDRYIGRHGGNPLSYGMEAVDRYGDAFSKSASGPNSIYTPQAIADLVAPSHELGDHYGVPGQIADALQTTANVIPGLGVAQKGLSQLASPVTRALMHVPEALGRMTSWRPEGYAGGGKVSKIIKEIGNKFGDFQASRMQRAADETNLERIHPEGLRRMFDPGQSGLYTSMPPGNFQDYARRIDPEFADKTPYARSFNVPGFNKLRPEDRTQDWYLDNMAKLLERKGAYASPELGLGKTLDDMTNVVDHEGRHRMMAMDRLGDPRALVQLPNDSMRSMEPEERVDYLTQKYFPHGRGQLVVPEGYDVGSSPIGTKPGPRGTQPMPVYAPRTPVPMYSEPYAGGGKVKSKLATAVRDLAERVRTPDSGFTFDPVTGKEPSGGYAASLWPERSHILPGSDLSPQDLLNYVEKNRDLLDKPGHYMGAWHDPESHNAYLDVSKVGPDLNEIAHGARAANQKAIFDLNNFSSIDVGGTGEAIRSPQTYGPGFKSGGEVALKLAKRFLKDPVRESFPGIYKDPDVLVNEAKQRLVTDPGKEGPMYQLFGHTRDSLDELSQGNRDLDSIQPFLRQHPFNLSGSADVSKQVLTPKNAGRLTDMLGEALKDPQLRNTRSWYEMSPLWDRANELGVGDKGMRDLNNRIAVMSAGSDPRTEINRGFHANWLAKQGRLEDFIKYGGVPDEERGDWFPHDLQSLKGHAYHGTAQVPNLLDYEETGRLWPAKHKVPTYAAATDPKDPYSARPIADSHFNRILGYPDVSTATTEAVRQGVPSGTQYSDIVPWFNKNVADKTGLRPRDAQALLWNLGGPQTGVRYIGPSKLEMMSDYMHDTATKLGVHPEEARDLLLRGEIGGPGSWQPPFAKGGKVDDDFNLYQSQFYAKGGNVVPLKEADDFNLYQSQFFNRGGFFRNRK